MKWQGETEAQWMTRTLDWHRRFALFPTHLSCGRWVWLEHYEIQREPTHSGRWYWIRRWEGSRAFEPGPQTPPPPKPMR
jgi:hypothetical protein